MKKMKLGIEITVTGLAKVFAKYNYFSEEQADLETYGILMEVYNALSFEIKDKLRERYKQEIKSIRKKENEKK